jgi:hypothetical protein
MRYPGGKNTVFRTLINLMPEHEIYIEPFLGSGPTLKNKLPVYRNIGIDLDSRAILQAKEWSRPELELIVGNGIQYLQEYSFTGKELVYCDPPYLHSTRRSKQIYKYEMSDSDHKQLIALINTIPCNVMLSGKPSQLYEDSLRDWHVIEIDIQTHVGLQKELIWLNYEPPVIPQDIRFLGNNFREREQIQRRHQRLIAKIDKLPLRERALLWNKVTQKYRQELDSASSTLHYQGEQHG